MRKPVNVTTDLMIVIPQNSLSVEQKEKGDRVMHIVGLVFTYVFLIAMALIVFFPFYYMIVGSFMREEYLNAGHVFPAAESFFENISYNYQETLSRFNYFRYVGNTLLVGVSTTVLQMLVTIISAFAFARLTFRGRDFLFTCFLATMMIPGEMMVITNYTTMANLGLIGNHQTYLQAIIVMVIPFVSSVFYIYLLRQNFKQIPNELYLAAKVDGKSDWEYLWKVMVPLASPTLITIAILSIIGSWNAYVWPKLTVNEMTNSLISVAIRGQTLALEDPNGIMITQNSWTLVASVLTVVPLLVLFIIFRKYIMSGTGRAGIKG